METNWSCVVDRISLMRGEVQLATKMATKMARKSEGLRTLNNSLIWNGGIEEESCCDVYGMVMVDQCHRRSARRQALACAIASLSDSSVWRWSDDCRYLQSTVSAHFWL